MRGGTHELPYTNGTSPSRAGGAYGTSPCGGAYGTSVLTGEALTGLYTGRPLTARPRRAPKALRDQPPCGTNRFYGDPLRDEIASLQTGGAYKTSLLTGRRRLRDEPPDGPEAEAYGTSLFTGRRRWDEPPYRRRLRRTSLLWRGGIHRRAYERRRFFTGRRRLWDLRDECQYAPKTLTGRASLRAGGGGLRDEPPCGTEALGGSFRARGAYGTSLLTLTTGGAYGTSHLTPWGAGRRRLRDEPPYGRSGPTLLARRHSRTSLLTLTGRRRSRDEPPYGGAYGTSVLTGRRRLRYRPELRASIRDGPLPRDFVLAPRK